MEVKDISSVVLDDQNCSSFPANPIYRVEYLGDVGRGEYESAYNRRKEALTDVPCVRWLVSSTTTGNEGNIAGGIVAREDNSFQYVVSIKVSFRSSVINYTFIDLIKLKRGVSYC